MKQIYLTILLVLCALAGTATTAQAETITKTYLFSGSQSGTTCQGYFYEEGAPGTHYDSSPATWTYGSTGSISFTLADGITFTFADANNRISVLQGQALGGGGK